MRRIKIQLAYDGTDYHGWQVQPGLATIQSSLQQVISELEGRPVEVAGSGRTDAGVHALAQVAAFSIENPIPVENLVRAMNRLLKPDEDRIGLSFSPVWNRPSILVGPKSTGRTLGHLWKMADAALTLSATIFLPARGGGISS